MTCKRVIICIFKVLVDSLESVTVNPANPPNESQLLEKYPIREILMIGLGSNGSRPLLLVRLDKDLYMYEVFRFPRGNLKLRFKKIKHDVMYVPNTCGQIETDNTDFDAVQERIRKLRYFDNISGKLFHTMRVCILCQLIIFLIPFIGYNGVFICGANPYWLFLTFKGELRCHNMIIDGEVPSFASFNNINCPQGFLYFNKKVSIV